MKRLFALIVFALATIPAALFAQDGHEYSPLVEKTVNYKNWTLNDLKDNKPVDLRSLVAGKKLVMVVYFAPWCPNWRNEAPVAARLYEKYKDQGFTVIGVSEYGTRADVSNYFAPTGSPYTVVSESESREDREKTPHFGYRQLTGDTRRWGSPWNIFLEPATLAKTGDVLTEKAWVVNGELIEADADKFIADHLKTSTATVITPCKE
ncbi:MAG TPA: TlpA disulfide reductase family protein [Pyrinomonadaceae bacterium]|jgi:thiol-disulfide isomerase/thioredoxin|nr:TlpA disulfide reductase family protein [Pyrinomonadaceae bacterium]